MTPMGTHRPPGRDWPCHVGDLIEVSQPTSEVLPSAPEDKEMGPGSLNNKAANALAGILPSVCL